MSVFVDAGGKFPITLTVWIFSQTIRDYKPREASSCHNIVIRAIYGGWISKNDCV